MYMMPQRLIVNDLTRKKIIWVKLSLNLGVIYTQHVQLLISTHYVTLHAVDILLYTLNPKKK